MSGERVNVIDGGGKDYVVPCQLHQACIVCICMLRTPLTVCFAACPEPHMCLHVFIAHTGGLHGPSSDGRKHLTTMHVYAAAQRLPTQRMPWTASPGPAPSLVLPAFLPAFLPACLPTMWAKGGRCQKWPDASMEANQCWWAPLRTFQKLIGQQQRLLTTALSVHQLWVWHAVVATLTLSL